MLPELFFLAAELSKLFLLPNDKLLVFLGLELTLYFCLHVVEEILEVCSLFGTGSAHVELQLVCVSVSSVKRDLN